MHLIFYKKSNIIYECSVSFRFIEKERKKWKLLTYLPYITIIWLGEKIRNVKDSAKIKEKIHLDLYEKKKKQKKKEISLDL